MKTIVRDLYVRKKNDKTVMVVMSCSVTRACDSFIHVGAASAASILVVFSSSS